MAKVKIEAGATLGRFQLLERIDDDRGGNSEVWRAECSAQHFAVKILRRRDRLTRFLQEIDFLSGDPGDGVLSLVDKHLEGESVYWYSMPLATPLRKALEIDRSPQYIVEIFATYAEVLARLAAKGVSHRDIKPDNLFILDGKPVIGDFGLVTYPGKEPITEIGERMGPMYFHAPEMLENTDGADSKAADVWSFAKSMWVCLTGQNYPLPGEHRSGPAFDLKTWVSHPRIIELNNLILACTRIDPAIRPTMDEVAKELRASAKPPAEVRGDAAIAELRDRLVALTQPAIDAEQEVREKRDRLQAAGYTIGSHHQEVVAELRTMLGSRFKCYDSQGNDASVALQERSNTAIKWVATFGVRFVSPDHSGRVQVTYSAAAYPLDPGEKLQICGHFRVCERFNGLEHTLLQWQEIYSAAVGSSLFSDALAELHTAVVACEANSLQIINEVLARSEEVVPDWYRGARP